MKSVVLCLSLVAAVLIVGCTGSAFKENYRSSLELWPSGETTRLLPPGEQIEIVTSRNMRADALRMMENGFLLLGRSTFRSEKIDAKAARSLARELGATVVFVREKYAATVEETVPMSEWIPPREDTLKQTVVITEGPEAGQVIEQTIVKSTQGEFKTTYVPQTIDYYDYAATFWAKSKPPVFGVLVQAPAEELRQRLQSNRGVVIKAVIKDSPAYRADILREDVILRFADADIFDPDQFFEVVVAHQGELVEVVIDRNGQQRTFSVQLQTD